MHRLFMYEVRCKNKMAYTHSQGPTPPWRFLYLTETKSWRYEEGEGTEKNVHLLTHATARGVGKKYNRTAKTKQLNVHWQRLR